LLALIRKGLTREQAYDLVQRNAMKTWQAKHAGKTDADFKAELLADPDVAKHLSKAELDEICSLDFHYQQIEARFKSLGL
jgi:adenylosuccinate lyase